MTALHIVAAIVVTGSLVIGALMPPPQGVGGKEER